MTSAIRHQVILGLSGAALVRIIWSGVRNNIVRCFTIRRLNVNFITTSRLWKLAILVCWFCLAGEVLMSHGARHGVLTVLNANNREIFPSIVATGGSVCDKVLKVPLFLS